MESDIPFFFPGPDLCNSYERDLRSLQQSQDVFGSVFNPSFFFVIEHIYSRTSITNALRRVAVMWVLRSGWRWMGIALIGVNSIVTPLFHSISFAILIRFGRGVKSLSFWRGWSSSPPWFSHMAGKVFWGCLLIHISHISAPQRSYQCVNWYELKGSCL